MNLPLLNWFTRADGLPSLVHDMRSGRAGLMMRVALSLAAAAVSASIVMVPLGMMEIAGYRVHDEHALLAFSLAGVLWCGALAWVWAGYRRWQRTIRTVFGLVALWALLIPVCAAIGAAIRQSDFLIASLVVFGIGVTLAVIATVTYRSIGGNAVRDQAGSVQVRCPRCGYSMIGLETCQCPECGHRCTIDALIAEQDYASLRDARQSASAASLSPMPDLDASAQGPLLPGRA